MVLPVVSIPMVLVLAIPEYLKELTFNKFPDSLLNWTAPERLDLSLLTRKALLFLISCQTRASDIFI